MIAGDCQWPPRRQPLWIPSSLNRLSCRVATPQAILGSLSPKPPFLPPLPLPKPLCSLSSLNRRFLPCRYFPSHSWIPFPRPHSLPPGEQGPLWIPPTLYGGVIKPKGPPWGRPPMVAMHTAPLYLSFFYFFGVTNVLGRSGTGAFQPDERAGGGCAV